MITRQHLCAIEMLTSDEINKLPYKNHPLSDFATVASPQGLVKRAHMLRYSTKPTDFESLAAHLELAAETISELCRYLPRDSRN